MSARHQAGYSLIFTGTAIAGCLLLAACGSGGQLRSAGELDRAECRAIASLRHGTEQHRQQRQEALSQCMARATPQCDIETSRRVTQYRCSR